MPFVVVGDEAFPLKTNLMRPYPGKSIAKSRKENQDLLAKQKRIFNYRLSRARRVVENAFGIMVQKWRIFKVPINAAEDLVELIIKASTCLHNFLLERKSAYYANVSTISNVCLTGTAFSPIVNKQTSHTRTAGQVRDEFANYFATDGALNWQDAKIFQ